MPKTKCETCGGDVLSIDAVYINSLPRNEWRVRFVHYVSAEGRVLHERVLHEETIKTVDVHAENPLKALTSALRQINA